jgi:hypothetical protein
MKDTDNIKEIVEAMEMKEVRETSLGMAIEDALLPLSQFKTLLEEIGTITQITDDPADIRPGLMMDSLSGLCDLVENETRQRLLSLADETEDHLGKINLKMCRADEYQENRKKVVSAWINQNEQAN